METQLEVGKVVSSGVEKIVAGRKYDEEDITAFKTSSGRTLVYSTDLDEVKSGKLAQVDVFHKYGRNIVRS
ncbi:DUF3892 domain-containing protein [Bacillus nitratireducens]